MQRRSNRYLSGAQNALFVSSFCVADPDFRPNLPVLASLITARTRAIAWATPNNPSGVTLSGAQAHCHRQTCRASRPAVDLPTRFTQASHPADAYQDLRRACRSESSHLAVQVPCDDRLACRVARRAAQAGGPRGSPGYEFMRALCESQRVSVMDGAATTGFVCVCFATDERLIDSACQRIRRFCSADGTEGASRA